MMLLWKARPHEWGPGKCHFISDRRTERTLCGKPLEECPGERVISLDVDCKVCLGVLEQREKRKQRPIERCWRQDYSNVCESPIEKMFFNALEQVGFYFNKYDNIVKGKCGEVVVTPQYTFTELRYRVDFLFEVWDKTFCVEIDGHDFHSSKEQRGRDAKRDRELLAAGYPVLRFTGTEIYRDPEGCAEEALGRCAVNAAEQKWPAPSPTVSLKPKTATPKIITMKCPGCKERIPAKQFAEHYEECCECKKEETKQPKGALARRLAGLK